MEWRDAGCEGVDERGEKTHLEKPVKVLLCCCGIVTKFSKNVQLPEFKITIYRIYTLCNVPKTRFHFQRQNLFVCLPSCTNVFQATFNYQVYQPAAAARTNQILSRLTVPEECGTFTPLFFLAHPVC